MEQNVKLRIGVKIQQRQPDSSLVIVEFSGQVANAEGSKEQIAHMLLEAEQHGNDGKSRIYISMEEIK